MKKHSRAIHKAKWALTGIGLLLLALCVSAFFFRETILQKAGAFMGPRGDYCADIAILGGTSFLDRPVADAGFELLRAGKVKRLVIVLHNINPLHRPYSLNDNYPDMVRKEILKRGLTEKNFKVLVVRIDHPITLTEAQNAMKVLALENIKSAILLSPGFHTRRSYLVYQHAANPYGIKIYSQACFSQDKAGNWYENGSGRREFAVESVKLAYYVLGGYIPFKFSY